MSATFDERGFLEKWRDEFSRAIEMFSGKAPTVQIGLEPKKISSLDEFTGYFWWKQRFQAPGGYFVTWVGSPKDTWSAIGGVMAEDESSVKSIYLEILGQAEQGAATLLTPELGQVQCQQGEEEESCSSTLSEVWQIQIQLGDKQLEPLVYVIDHSQFTMPVSEETEPEPAAKAAGRPPNASRAAAATVPAATVGQLLDLELPLSVVLGRSALKMQNVLKLTSGSVVELDATVLDRVEVLVHGKVIARGEVVSVKGNYGVRITELIPGKLTATASA
jgi:flagellar motor switch protein FliN/FliY